MAEQHMLENVEIERVDAVDRPATRRRWLILKSEEEDEEMVNIETLTETARAVLETLAKESGDGLPLSEEAIAALNALANLLEFQATFKAKAKPDETYGYPQPEKKPAKKNDNDEDSEATAKHDDEYGYPSPEAFQSVVQTLQALLAEVKALREALTEKKVEKSAYPLSRQPQGEERPVSQASRKWGEGLFVDVVFGQ